MSTKLINCCQKSINFIKFVIMKRYFVLIVLCALLHLSSVAQNEFVGMCGAELKEYLRDKYSPTTTIKSMTGEGGVWSIFAQCDVNADGAALDRYSTNKYYYPQDKMTAPIGMVVNSVVNKVWWGNAITDAIEWDLYNILPCNELVPQYKNDYMPGEVVDTIYTNGVWTTGWGSIYGERINVYTPPHGYEGDFARIIMYMATIYSVDSWHGQGVNFFSDGVYPTLNGYSKILLLQWHALDPVSDLELNRNNIIASVQGNRNPFVDFPQLVDYIWGEKSSQPYAPEQEEQEKERIPLRATYSVSTDEKIDLYSPYIPNDVTWTVNGVEISSESIETKSLGLGVHELQFESKTIKGKLKIKIVE